MGGLRPKNRALTVKWGWSVCIIAYNDNGCEAGRAELVQAGGCRLRPYALRLWPFCYTSRIPGDSFPLFPFSAILFHGFVPLLSYFSLFFFPLYDPSLFSYIFIQQSCIAVFIGFYLFFWFIWFCFNSFILIFCIVIVRFLRTQYNNRARAGIFARARDGNQVTTIYKS